MKVGLFIPCYVDQFYPRVGIATLGLLNKLGCDVIFPPRQTCCGQPMANAGFAGYSADCNRSFIKNFKGFDYIVSPSGSCVLHIKEHLHDQEIAEEANFIRHHIYELSEFLVDVLKVDDIKASFPHKVGLHLGCHAQRGLGLSSMSERMDPCFSKIEQLLFKVKGIDLLKTERWDECCGFGGSFCVTEEAVSVAMGLDRIQEHAINKVEFITSNDMSCLMHLEGLLHRQKHPIKVIHLAEILNSYEEEL